MRTHFNCSMCKEKFELVLDGSWTEEDAKKEAEENFGESLENWVEDSCDDCYIKMDIFSNKKVLELASEIIKRKIKGEV